MTPDNGITFLDNGSFVKNPTNCKTPPPPLWGAVLEEDLYDNSQPFYDAEKAAKAEMERRLAQKIKDGEITAEEKKKFKIKRQIVYTIDKDESPTVNDYQEPSRQYTRDSPQNLR